MRISIYCRLVGILAFAWIVAACTGENNKNNGTVRPEDKAENDTVEIVRRPQPCPYGFYQITHIGSFDVIYREGDYSLEFEGDSTLFPSVIADYDSGTLTLKRRGENNIDIHAFSAQSKLKVYVSSPELRLLAVCNNGSFQSIGTIHTTDMQIGALGQGSISIDSVQCQSLVVQNNDVGSINFTSCHTTRLDILSKNSGCITGDFNVDGETNITITGNAVNTLSCKSNVVNLLSTGETVTTLDVDCDKFNIQAVGKGVFTFTGRAREKHFATNPLGKSGKNVVIIDEVKAK